jgi:hypothetical protein
MRKLASVQKVLSLTPIDGADRIETAKINGWNVVVQKGLHQVGDLVCYFEIDSLLPVVPEYEFLRKSSYVKESQEGEGFRLKTIKLRGQVSQGLIIPLRELPGYGIDNVGPYFVISDEAVLRLEEGIDLTDFLNVKKYEKIIPASLAGMVRGMFPGNIKKTDQERCLSANTMITTSNGLLDIKTICESKEEFEVLSYNHDNNIFEYKKVIDKSIMRKITTGWYRLTFENGEELICTGNHKIFINDFSCYRETKFLKIGDDVIISNN